MWDVDDEMEAATPAETRAAMLRPQMRGYTQVRGVFVQLPDGDGTPGSRASTLAKMVHERRHRALLLYILLLGAWRGLEGPDSTPLQADVWIRALTAPRGLTWSRSTLSRAWTTLEEMDLVVRKREDRTVRVTPRREDGAGVYERPSGRRDRMNKYFVLPDEFWTEDWFAKLSLPALAVLLVIAKETNNESEVRLTYPQFEDWYGIRRKTAQNGVAELRHHGLLNVRRNVIKAPLSPTGTTVETWYSLTGPFGHQSRKARQKRAQDERAARQASGVTAVVAANAVTPGPMVKRPREEETSA